MSQKTLALLVLAAAALSSPVAAGAADLPNLDFSAGKLTHWEGEGFAVTALGSGKRARHAVTSADSDTGKKALLHRTFVVPAGTGEIRFLAAAIRPEGARPKGALDVVLEAAGREIVPCQAREEGGGWRPVAQLLGLDGKAVREYRWLVAPYTGRRVRIAVLDQDDRPGCHLYCTGFRLVSQDEEVSAQMARDMRRFQQKHRLAPFDRFDSRHFICYSNTSSAFSKARLEDCETVYKAFFPHFRKKGFAVRPPEVRMMVVIVDRPEGLEAYLGQKLAPSVTGFYHPASNRLLVYDYANNADFKEAKKRLEGGSGGPLVSGRLALASGQKKALREIRDNANVSTITHEVAHQLSFNAGLLSRKGDLPLWLAEGLAVYCEAAERGTWQGIGQPNLHRAQVLSAALDGGGGGLLPIRALASSDDWYRKAPSSRQVLLGYAQSWALFRLLIDERPKQLRAYLAVLHGRRTPDHRLADFVSGFGGDLGRLERRYKEYVREIVRKEVSATAAAGR